MPTPARAPNACRAAASRRSGHAPAGAATALAAALLLAGCASAPRLGEVSMQAPVNASTGCYAPRPNPRAAYNRDYSVLGHSYAPLRSAAGYEVDGTASWYGWESGKTTSMGTYFNPRAFTAASRVLPLPTCVEVTNLRNGRSALVLVNDRGPFVDSRVMDLSYGAAKALGVTATGTAPVRIVALAHGRVQDAPPPGAAPPAPAAAVPSPGVAPAQTNFPPEPVASQPLMTARAMQVTSLPPLGAAPTPAAGASGSEAPADDAVGALLADASPTSPTSPTSSAAPAASSPAPTGAVPQQSVAQAPVPAGALQTYAQTGAFTIEGNAQLEADRLRRAGIGPVEVVPGYVHGRTWYKVQIGPLGADDGQPGLARKLARIGLRDYTLVQQ